MTPPDGAVRHFVSLVQNCGQSGVFLDQPAAAAKLIDTLALATNECTPAVLRLSSAQEIELALGHARRAGVRVHPISSGHNWGYGTARPSQPHSSVIFDLSAMNRILQFDSQLGVVTLEPGVTQAQLSTFLHAQNAKFMVPTTGAGPNCSLMGNALERGYGMTPIADHFQAVLGLSAILADGSTYHSPFAPSCQGNSEDQLPIYRWGVGPYLDGLFSQSGGAIVTQMSLQLAALPASVEMFVFWLKSDDDLEAAVESARCLLSKSGLSIGGINIMNATRVSAMAGASMSGSAAWIGTGVMYGDKAVTKAGRRVIAHALQSVTQRLVFVTESRLRVLSRLSKLPGLSRVLSSTVASLQSALRLLSGTPSEFALALAYRFNAAAMPAANRDPARDGCGLLWYAPIVPMIGSQARRYTEMVKRVCSQFGFDAPITFSALSVSAFDSTVPILFEPNAANSERAMQCLRALISEGRAMGFNPYRFHSALMDEGTQGADAFWALSQRVRSALDPLSLIAPGRYQRVASDLRD